MFSLDLVRSTGFFFSEKFCTILEGLFIIEMLNVIILTKHTHRWLINITFAFTHLTFTQTVINCIGEVHRELYSLIY